MDAYRPKEYSITLEPDLDQSTFTGSCHIAVDLGVATEVIVLNAADLDIGRCICNYGMDRKECAIELDKAAEELRVQLPQKVAGALELQLNFTGILNDLMRGFYRAPYIHNGEERIVAVTQFEEIDARRAFPCFDHPAFNAAFDVEIIIQDKLSAIANTPVASEVSLGNGKKSVRFVKTPPMPTYLLFFGVGDFDFLEDSSWRVPIRIAATAGKAHLGKSSIAFAREALAFCESFTGVEYPLGKMDLIAAPLFAYGAMENFGAVLYRESLVLIETDAATTRHIESIARITAHEIAHMWFGDMVSPVDWQYMWLNESFATYLGYLVLNTTHPEWINIDQFIHGASSAAMVRDSLIETIPIEFPDKGMTEIDSATAPIVYEKAGSILRMLHAWLGDEMFTGGIREFLNRYKYGSVDTDGFVKTFGDGSSKKASEIIAKWVRTKGFPILRASDDGKTLTISQERFTYLTNSSTARWIVPLNLNAFLEDGSSRTIRLLVEEKEHELALPEGTVCYKLNADQEGLYRCAYSDQNLMRIGELIRSDRLNPRDQYGIIGDLSALFVKGEVTFKHLLNYLLSNFQNKTEYLPVSGICDALFTAYSFVPSRREDIAYAGRVLLEPVSQRIGVYPAGEESYDATLLRDTVVWALCLFDLDKVGEQLLVSFHSLKAGRTIDTDLIPLALRAGAWLEPDSLAWLIQYVEKDETSETMKRHLYSALGWAGTGEGIQQAMTYTMSSVPDESKLYVVRSLAQNTRAEGHLWPWFAKGFNRINALHQYFRSGFIAGVVPNGGPEREEEIRDFFGRYLEEEPKAPVGTVNMALEKLRIRNSVIQRDSP